MSVKGYVPINQSTRAKLTISLFVLSWWRVQELRVTRMVLGCASSNVCFLMLNTGKKTLTGPQVRTGWTKREGSWSASLGNYSDLPFDLGKRLWQCSTKASSSLIPRWQTRPLKSPRHGELCQSSRRFLRGRSFQESERTDSVWVKTFLPNNQPWSTKKLTTSIF